jgi:beta-aspartyl-peptidase (threonine type)
MHKFSIAIHGGAGTIEKEKMTSEMEHAYLAALKQALDAGYAVLENRGSSLEAVKIAVMLLEDNILFNAGKGSVFTKEGTHEMDASIMDGKTLMAGAVAAVRHIRNPVLLAEKVMTESPHVFMTAPGVQEFADKMNLQKETDEYFFSQFRYDQWQEIKNSDQYQLDHSTQKEKKFGTVGAVACDQEGNIAAATSTGGMTNKQFGRVGDSAIIGCGTYANNKTCAISCTGHGELFIRAVAAYDVSALMEYKGLSLYDAMDEVVNRKLVAIGGEGGMIGVNASGDVVMLFNSLGMYRAMRSSDGKEKVKIYK